MAFGFSQIVFNAVMQSLTGTSNNMQADAKNYQKEAESLLKQAEAFAAQARQFLSTIPNFKWVTVDTTDSEGNPTTTQEQQPDKEADAAAQASAADCEQKAADCNQNATQLQALVAALLAQIANLAKQILGFSNAGEETQKAITNSTSLLVTGASMIGKVISVFNVPEAKNVGDWAKGFGNNVLKTFVGVDLSDGIDTDEVNKIAGIVVDTGATVVSGFTSIVVGSLIASTPIGGTGLASLAVGAVRGGTNLLLNLGRDTAAKAVSGVIVSGLNFFGIEVKEPEKKDGEHEEVELDEPEIDPTQSDIDSSGENTEGTAPVDATVGDGNGEVEGQENQPQRLSPQELADDIWHHGSGTWGTGTTRDKNFKEAGYSDEEIAEIHKILTGYQSSSVVDNPNYENEHTPEWYASNAQLAYNKMRELGGEITILQSQRAELLKGGVSEDSPDILEIEDKIAHKEKQSESYKNAYTNFSAKAK